jgi:hypothetical protein
MSNLIGPPLIVTLAVETGGVGVTWPSPPPQEEKKRIEVMHTPARIAVFAQRL